jgi:hypothetical protein
MGWIKRQTKQKNENKYESDHYINRTKRTI